MTDRETLTSEPAQVIRRQMVSALGPYRSFLPLLPIPTYLRDTLREAIAALDQWTAETQSANRG
jgi:hypothetical protein